MRTKIEVKEFAKIDSASVYLDEFLLFVGDNKKSELKNGYKARISFASVFFYVYTD